jgi:hypothetical protein
MILNYPRGMWDEFKVERLKFYYLGSLSITRGKEIIHESYLCRFGLGMDNTRG